MSHLASRAASSILPRAIAIAAVAGVMALSACGGSGSQASSTSTTSTTTTSDAATSATTDATSATDAGSATSTASDADTSAASSTSTPSATSASSSATTTSSADAKKAAASASKAAVSAALTKPGTTLKIGQPATVLYSTSDITVAVKVRPLSIVKGKATDPVIKSLPDSDQAKGYIPYYIHWTITGDAGSSLLDQTPLSQSVGVLNTLKTAAEMMIYSGYATDPNCSSPEPPAGFGPGKSYQDCSIALAPKGTTVVGVAWVGRHAFVLDDKRYGSNPIIWKK